MQKQKAARGFTLLELMLSMAVGLIAMAAMAMLFKSGMNSTMFVTQRIETQENLRTAMDLMVKDISLAGAGLPSGGIQLPYGTGSSVSKYACDQTGTCHVPNDTYPSNTNPNYMYGIIPGYQDGVEGNAAIAAAPSPAFSDSITVVYADQNTLFPLWQYSVTFVAGSYTQVTLTPQAGYTPPVITSNGFLNQGDVIMISGGGTTAVGEITSYSCTSSTPGSTCSVTFANSDPLNLNQSGAASGNLKALATAMAGGSGVAYRLYVVSYYLNVPTAAGQTPRLMRQVNGLTPAPVADDIINLQFAYDNFNTSTDTLDANEANPLGAGESPNNIQKVNIFIMGESIINNQKNSQNLYLATDVSASNMAYTNPF